MRAARRFSVFDGPRRLPLAPITTPGLTPREIEIVKFAGYLLDSDLSELLDVKIDTVWKHLKNARDKWNEHQNKERN